MKISKRMIAIVSVALSVLTVIMIVATKMLLMALGGGNLGTRSYNYHPVDAKGILIHRWDETVERSHFSMTPLSVPNGSGMIGCLEVNNSSDKEIFVVSSVIITNGLSIKSKLDDSSEGLLERTIPAGRSKVVGLYWEFGTWLDEVLGQEITWVWNVRIGKADYSLRIPMRRN